MAALTERIDPILQNLWGRLQGVNLRQNGIFLALVGLILFFAATTPNAASLTPNNWSNLVVQNGYILVLAIGMVMVIIAGHIDLSVGSVLALAASTVSVAILGWGWSVLPAALLGMAVAALAGTVTGSITVAWRIPSFIVTLAGMLVFRGLTLWLLNGQNIGPFPKTFQSLSTGFIPDLFAVDKPNVTALVLVCASALAIVVMERTPA